MNRTSVLTENTGFARLLWLGVGEGMQKRAIAEVLDVFSNATANTSLLLSLTEAVLLTLVPKAAASEERTSNSGRHYSNTNMDP